MLIPSGIVDRRSMYCGKVSQSTFIETRIGSSGIDSLRESASLERSTSLALTGAKPNPQLPIVTEGTPGQPPLGQRGDAVAAPHRAIGIPMDLGGGMGVPVQVSGRHGK